MDEFDLLPPPMTTIKLVSALKQPPKPGDQVVHQKDETLTVYPVYCVDYYGPDGAVQVSLPDTNARNVIYFRDCLVVVHVEDEDEGAL